MLWRVRTTIDDQPGGLAALARACGQADVNIISLQVFKEPEAVTDELIVSVPDSLDEFALARMVESCGGRDVSVTPCEKDAGHDSATRYLHAAQRVLAGHVDIRVLLTDLLDTAGSHASDSGGHDTLTVTLPDGERVTVTRAVPFTPTERTRAQALASLVAHRTQAAMLPLDDTLDADPLIREATIGDVQAVADLHDRCSADTLFARYQMPLAKSMSPRMARRLVHPEAGLALVAQVGLDVVGHGVVERESPDVWSFGVLIEDAWQGRGLGSALAHRAAEIARSRGARELVLVTHGASDRLLHTVRRAGFDVTVTHRDTASHLHLALR